MSHISTPPTAAHLAINDLSDAVATAEHIFEAANALFESISGNALSLDKFDPDLRLRLGPIAGLAWSLGELDSAIKRVRELVDVLPKAVS